jgi:dTDP-4-amino-4,6-dideoxygalactose transaminase
MLSTVDQAAPDRAASMTVPVYRASLPTAEALLPYLRIIDANRHYANRGELVCRLEHRLREIIAGPGCAVLTAASGTAALQAAILAQSGRATPSRPVALIAGCTFVATAMAAEACGYAPVFVDVDPVTWAIDPDALRHHPSLGEAGIVLAVAPYGRPHDHAAWQHFTAATGVPVVIDAAASFEALMRAPNALTGTVPVVLSFHATKSFATGEGGAVIWSDIAGLERCAQALNFGFLYSRESRAAGFNGKMSEYHAAVGLAGLDRLGETLAGYGAANAAFAAAAEAHGIGWDVIVGPAIASNYALFRAVSAEEARRICTGLVADGIEHRFWYGPGVHREPYFAPRSQAALPQAEALGDRLIGLPMFPGIETATIESIVRCIARCRW